MEIITKQLKAMLHIVTYLPWENHKEEETILEKFKEGNKIMFQHHKETQCAKKTWMHWRKQPYLDRKMFHPFMRND